MTTDHVAPDPIAEFLGDTTPPATAAAGTAAPVEAPATLPAARTDKRLANGRFVKGHPGGPGRTPGRGLDLRSLAEREAKREGFDLNQAAWRVLKRLFAMAEAGDVAAAKLVLDKLGIVEGDERTGVQLVVVTGVDPAGAPAQGIGLRVTATPGVVP
jgi:hypothetical protein